MPTMGDRPKKLGPRCTVSVTPSDYEVLNALAERDDVSVSWVIRRAIQEYLGRHQLPPARHPKAPSKRSFAR
jgi:hypothetical protein